MEKLLTISQTLLIYSMNTSLQWGNVWSAMPLHAKSMLIGSKQNVCNTDLNISIAGSSVVQVNYVKCLGVIIDERLSWGPHVEYVKKTVSSNLGMLNRIRNCVPQSSLHSLFVQSINQ